MKNDAFKVFNAGKFGEALKKCRLHIAWYILCHRAHTVPFLESDTKESKELLEIDIEALASLIDLLMACYERTGKHKEFPSALNALQNAIEDTRWYNKIAFHRAAWQLLDSDDKKLVFHELQKITDIDTTADIETIMLYIHVYPDKLPFAKKIALIDRILRAKPRPGIALQYETLRGIELYLIGDSENGFKIIHNAIEKFKHEGLTSPSSYDLLMIGQSLEILGEFTGNKDLLEEAILYFKKQFAFDLEPEGLAMIHSNIAHSLLHSGKLQAAKEAFEKSLAINPLDITKVFLGRCAVQLGQLSEAERILSSVNIANFGYPEKFDYAIAWAMLAVDAKEKELLDRAENLLAAISPSEPYFADLAHLHTEIGKVRVSASNSNSSTIIKALKGLRWYLVLQPNFFGLGINLGNMVEDAEQSLIKMKDASIKRRDGDRE
jgi:tetratricopeptide (TPR) repeat protein